MTSLALKKCRSRWSLSVLCGCLLLSSQPPARASEPKTIETGSRVRLSAPETQNLPLIGTLEAVVPDTLVIGFGPKLRWDGTTVETDARRVPIRSISKLELSRGMKSHAASGAVIGLLIGGVVGGVTGAQAENEYVGTGMSAAAGAGAGALAGALLGAIMGSRARGEEWEVVHEIGDVRIGLGGQGTSCFLAAASLPF